MQRPVRVMAYGLQLDGIRHPVRRNERRGSYRCTHVYESALIHCTRWCAGALTARLLINADDEGLN
jgi:hypothetical protein